MSDKPRRIKIETKNNIDPGIVGKPVPLLMGFDPDKCIGIARIVSIDDGWIVAEFDFESDFAKIMISDWPKDSAPSLMDGGFLPVLRQVVKHENEYEIIGISIIPGAMGDHNEKTKKYQ